jgi:hypothetical protein
MKTLKNSRPFKVAIIGAGPSGLAAAHALLPHKKISTTICDTGSQVSKRNHRNAWDITRGVGGAGLFSDGKFSFFPANSTVYRVGDRKCLDSAYRWLSVVLRSAGIAVEPLPTKEEIEHLPPRALREGKNYQSHYGTLEKRISLIQTLEEDLSDRLLLATEVTSIDGEPQNYWLCCTSKGKDVTIGPFNAIIVATGKFGTDLLLNSPKIIVPALPLRYEFGIRLDLDRKASFFKDSNCADIKKFWNVGPLHFRTFCTCLNGEVWAIPSMVGWTLSGRSDGITTTHSNLGFLVRYAGSAIERGQSIWSTLKERLKKQQFIIWQPMREMFQLDNRSNGFYTEPPWFPSGLYRRGLICEAAGDMLFGDLLVGLKQLLSWSDDLIDATCLFPSIEGLGEYPNVDASFKIPIHSIWACGDVLGQIRGIVPAFINGFYVGSKVADFFSAKSQSNSLLL